MSSKTRQGIVENPDLPPLAEAAGLALTVLRAAKKVSWADLVIGTDDSGGDIVEVPYGIELTERQERLLREHHKLLLTVQRSTPVSKNTDGEPIEGTGNKPVTYVVCPSCQRWMLISSKPAPSRCVMTSGCEGSPVKSSALQFETAPSDRSSADSTSSSDSGHIDGGNVASEDLGESRETLQPPAASGDTSDGTPDALGALDDEAHDWDDVLSDDPSDLEVTDF